MTVILEGDFSLGETNVSSMTIELLDWGCGLPIFILTLLRALKYRGVSLFLFPFGLGGVMRPANTVVASRAKISTFLSLGFVFLGLPIEACFYNFGLPVEACFCTFGLPVEAFVSVFGLPVEALDFAFGLPVEACFSLIFGLPVEAFVFVFGLPVEACFSMILGFPVEA